MSRRVLGFSFYGCAAAANLLPILMLAMDTAFGGLNPQSFRYVTLTLSEVISMILLAVAAAALLARRTMPRALYLIGPVLSLCVAVIFFVKSLTVESFVLGLLEGVFAVGALMLGMNSNKLSEELRQA